MKQKFINQMEPWIGKEESQAVAKYLHSGGWLTEFKQTEKFEQMIADYVGSKYASVVNNGTVSLFIALMALGIGRGDEIIVPDFTMIASANAVLLAGAKPVLVDIDPATLCLDLKLAEAAITKKTKAIMLVSLNGRAPDMNKVRALCKKYNLFLIEDAAQSLGSQWNEKMLGTFGIVGSFSFSVPKVITTGQGGALVTNNEELIKKIRKIKDFGRVKSGVDQYETLGFNFKFTDLQAVIGIEQMKKLKWRVNRKKEMFALYKKELEAVKGIEFIQTNLNDTSPWFIDVLVDNRQALMEYLSKSGIGTRIFYPPLHTQAPYKDWKEYKKAKFLESLRISNQGLWLPSSSFLRDEAIKKICKKIRDFFE